MKKIHNLSLVLARYTLAIEVIRLVNKLITLLNVAINYKTFYASKVENPISA
jgi:hypothetical protein